MMRGLLDRARNHPCRVVPTGWVCPRGHGHNGACTPQPAWWNAAARARVRDALSDEARDSGLIIGLTLLLAAVAVAVGVTR